MTNRVKPKIIMYRLCQIAVNWKLWHKFKKCKFCSSIKAKLHKTRHVCSW